MRPQKTNALSILGMHRSGTSSVTRIVNLLGAYVGEEEDLMRPGPDNPAGFWEHDDIVPFHERLLAALRRTWDTAFPLPPDWHKSEDIAPFWDELSGLVESLFSGRALWAFKDPRTSILLPLWKDVLAALEIELSCLLVYRNPLDVAKSLETRDGFPRNESYGLWFNHNLAMLQHSASVPRRLISYHDIIDDPARSVPRWAPHFSLAWPDEDAMKESIVQTIRSELCHSRSTLEDLASTPCPGPVRELAALLDEIANAGGRIDPDHEVGIRRLHETHASFSGLYMHDFSRVDARNRGLEARCDQLEDWHAKAKIREQKKDDLLDERKNLLAEKDKAVAESEERLAESLSRLAEQEQALSEAESRLAAALATVEKDEARIAATDTELAGKQQALDAALASIEELEARLAESAAQSANTERALAAAESRFDAARAEIREKESRLGKSRAAIAEKDKALAEARAGLATREGEAAVLRGRLDRFEATWSWRVTRPLRFGIDVIKTAQAKLREFSLRKIYKKATRVALTHLSALSALLPARSWGDAERGPPVGEDGAPEISVVIPVFNKVRLTRRCLHALHRHESAFSFEVIVVDDGSTDKTAAVVEKIPAVRLVRREANGGFGAACNRGAKEARGKYLVFLNNDTTVCDGWLDALRGTFDDWPQAGLVGSKLILKNGTVQECGGLIFRDGSAANYGRGGDPRDPRFCFTREMDYVSGAAIMTRRDLFRELEGFDPRYEPAYYEDTDLALRVREKGLQVVVNPHAEVNHVEGGTSGTDTSKGIKRYQEINEKKFLERWQGSLAGYPVRPTDGFGPRKTGPRVLVLDYQVPKPDRDSGSLRMVGVLRALVRIGCHVTLGAGGFRCDEGREVQLERIGIEVLRRPWNNDINRYFEEEGASFDFVILSRRDVATQHIELAERYCTNARIVFDTVDLHFLRESREAALGESATARDELEKLKALELALVARSDVTLVVSPVERDILRRELPEQDVRVVSNVLDIKPTPRPFAERAGLLFIGWFTHPPNVGAVLWFANEVLPELNRRGFDPVLHVIGADPPREIRALHSEQVRIHGFVPDVEPFFDRCLLSVAPLRYGAGVKGKINQSMALGVPVVTTSIGAEGMALEDGVNCLIADDPEEFAAHVQTACQSEALWTALREQGLRNIEAHFSPAVAEAALRDLVLRPAAIEAA